VVTLLPEDDADLPQGFPVDRLGGAGALEQLGYEFSITPLVAH
jgi:hypothetical protein